MTRKEEALTVDAGLEPAIHEFDRGLPLKASFTILLEDCRCEYLQRIVVRTMSKRVLTFVAGFAIAAGAATHAAAQEPLFVTVDQARVMQISRPAETVIVGNPAIADAVIRDSQTLVITGRSYGTTNLIVLDAEGQPIADELLTVQSADDYLVTMYVGQRRATYSCTPACQPTVAVGDDLDLFQTRVGQVQDASSLSR